MRGERRRRSVEQKHEIAAERLESGHTRRSQWHDGMASAAVTLHVAPTSAGRKRLAPSPDRSRSCARLKVEGLRRRGRRPCSTRIRVSPRQPPSRSAARTG